MTEEKPEEIIQEESPKQPNATMEFLFKYRIVMMLLGILFLIVAVWMVLSPVASNISMVSVPSEETCQRFGNSYGVDMLKVASKYWCEYNETGWHFNKTLFLESLKVTT